MATAHRLAGASIEPPDPDVELPNDPQFQVYPVPGEHQYVPGYGDGSAGSLPVPATTGPDHATARNWRPYTGQNVHGRAWPAKSQPADSFTDDLPDNIDRSVEATDEAVLGVAPEDLVTVKVAQVGPVRVQRAAADQVIFSNYTLTALVPMNVAQYVPNRGRVVLSNLDATHTAWVGTAPGISPGRADCSCLPPNSTRELNYNGGLFVVSDTTGTIVDVVQEMWNSGDEAGEIKVGW
jgi:hypothetical protein